MDVCELQLMREYCMYGMSRIIKTKYNRYQIVSFYSLNDLLIPEIEILELSWVLKEKFELWSF